MLPSNISYITETPSAILKKFITMLPSNISSITETPSVILKKCITMLPSNISYITGTPSVILKNIQPYDLMIQFSTFFTLYIVLCCVAYIILVPLRDFISKTNYFYLKSNRVLIVIAHPDDECMFFGPLIVSLVRRQKIVHVLCLSNGDAENKGHLRKYELYESCKMLGVLPDNITLTCNTSRQDGHRNKWETENIAELILDYVEKYSIDTAVTFDNGGVSGHPNHISLFRAVSFLNFHNQLPANCSIYVLNSIGLMRKYSSVLDCLVSFITSKIVLIISSHEHDIVKQAMRKHRTQYIWYRQLYMFFSCYTYINTLRELFPRNS